MLVILLSVRTGRVSEMERRVPGLSGPAVMTEVCGCMGFVLLYSGSVEWAFAYTESSSTVHDKTVQL